MNRATWLAIGKKRLQSVLRNHIVATERTLEQKISDAGPEDQRIEPLILTQARNELINAGVIVPMQRQNAPWFHLSETPMDRVEERIQEMEPVYDALQNGDFRIRLGQVLEIAVFKALRISGQVFLGDFPDLSSHDDSTQYKKVEPPLTISGKTIEKGPVDFILAQTECTAGIEIKNYRNWIYPDTPQVKDLLSKCSDIDAVPVLIARRIPFITFRLLNLSGVLVHQNYNQLYPATSAALAQQAKDKTLLGYHDIRLGSDPDDRLQRFISINLPRRKAEAYQDFLQFKDIHGPYGKGQIGYDEWVREILTRRGVWSEWDRGEGDLGDFPF